MEHIAVCDQRTLDNIARALGRAALGRRVSFWFDGGVTRRVEDGKTVEIPNGTLSFHLYVDGGAADHEVGVRPGEPARDQR